MKTLLTFSLFISVTSFACPNLSGNYKHATLNRSQKVTQDASKIQLGEGALVMLIDGQSHDISGQGGTLTYKVTCTDTKVTIDMKAVSNGTTLLGQSELTQTANGYREVSKGFSEEDNTWIRLN